MIEGTGDATPPASPPGTQLLKRNSKHSDDGLVVVDDLGNSDNIEVVEMNKYGRLFPANMKELTRSEIAWHTANYFIPFHEIQSYSLEFSGMLGDLGLYIPIVVLLSLNGQIDLGTTLVTTGLCNILKYILYFQKKGIEKGSEVLLEVCQHTYCLCSVRLKALS